MVSPYSGRATQASVSHAELLDSLVGLCALVFAHDEEDKVLSLAAQRLPELCPCSVERAFLQQEEQLVGWPSHGGDSPDDELIAQLKAMGGNGGLVTLGGRRQARALPLTGPDAVVGYLVVSGPRRLPEDRERVLAAVAGVVGAALAGIAARRRFAADRARIDDLAARVDALTADTERYGLLVDMLGRGVAGGAGESAIAEVLHRVTGRSVIIEDAQGRRRAAAGPLPSRRIPEPIAERRAWRLAQSQRSHRPVRDGELLVVPAAPHGEFLGALAMLDPERTASPFEVFALEQAAMVLALELFHQHRLADVRTMLERDFVDDLLSGLDDDTAHSRAAVLQRDVGTPRCVLLLRWRQATADMLASAVDRVIADMRLDALSSRRDGMTVMIAGLAQHGTAQMLGQDLYRRLAAALGPDGSIGVGAAALRPSQLPRSLREARQALSVRALSHAPAGSTAFDDLGVYRILARPESRSDVEQFVDEWLGALIDYDTSHRTEMVRTVAAYCESGGNYDRTALLLRIHRSTLRYRLQRVREISGYDLNNVDARFNLQVAARAWRVLSGAA